MSKAKTTPREHPRPFNRGVLPLFHPVGRLSISNIIFTLFHLLVLFHLSISTVVLLNYDAELAKMLILHVFQVMKLNIQQQQTDICIVSTE